MRVTRISARRPSPGRRGRRGDAPQGESGTTPEALSTGPDFSLEELREFLEADQSPVEADPAFKAALRERLWDLVRIQQLHGGVREEGDG